MNRKLGEIQQRCENIAEEMNILAWLQWNHDRSVVQFVNTGNIRTDLSLTEYATAIVRKELW